MFHFTLNNKFVAAVLEGDSVKVSDDNPESKLSREVNFEFEDRRAANLFKRAFDALAMLARDYDMETKLEFINNEGQGDDNLYAEEPEEEEEEFEDED